MLTPWNINFTEQIGRNVGNKSWIGETRGLMDLVFYHPILRRHEHIHHLNTHVAWFQKNTMRQGDNPPVGLLLCTGEDHAHLLAPKQPRKTPLRITFPAARIGLSDVVEEFPKWWG